MIFSMKLLCKQNEKNSFNTVAEFNLIIIQFLNHFNLIIIQFLNHYKQ